MHRVSVQLSCMCTLTFLVVGDFPHEWESVLRLAAGATYCIKPTWCNPLREGVGALDVKRNLPRCPVTIGLNRVASVLISEPVEAN